MGLLGQRGADYACSKLSSNILLILGRKRQHDTLGARRT